MNINTVCLGLPLWLSGKESACNAEASRATGPIPWRKAWLLSPVFLPKESHGQRILAGYSHSVAKSQTQLSCCCC